jgi:hypothetical protein
MAKPNKTQRKGVDDILRDRARGSTQRVLKDQRHLEEIGREVQAIKMMLGSMPSDIAESPRA